MKSVRLCKSVFVAGVVGVATLGALAATAEAKRLPRPDPGDLCVCPAIYAPVLCPNGQVYENACVAACHGQTGCELVGDIF